MGYGPTFVLELFWSNVNEGLNIYWFKCLFCFSPFYNLGQEPTSQGVSEIRIQDFTKSIKNHIKYIMTLTKLMGGLKFICRYFLHIGPNE